MKRAGAESTVAKCSLESRAASQVKGGDGRDWGKEEERMMDSGGSLHSVGGGKGT